MYRSSTGKTYAVLQRLHALSERFVNLCLTLFPFKKLNSSITFLCNEKIHSMLHCAAEIMRWGILINTSGEGPEGSHKLNVKGPGANTNYHEESSGTLMNHARRKETARLLGNAIQGINMFYYNVIFDNAC